MGGLDDAIEKSRLSGPHATADIQPLHRSAQFLTGSFQELPARRGTTAFGVESGRHSLPAIGVSAASMAVRRTTDQER